MFFIAHRGNFEGSSTDENSPSRIQKALDAKFHVEFDVWVLNSGWWLGHDSPLYKISFKFIEDLDQKRIWAHAKNLRALEELSTRKVQCFWHQEDDFTLTSTGFIWTYPEKNVGKNSVIVCKSMGELRSVVKDNVAAGVCADNLPADVRDKLI